jgi:hypothetical protein
MSNDISDLFLKCKDLSEKDPTFFMRIGICRLTLDEVKEIVKKMGKAVIDIGDGLTLLHLASQFGRADIVEYLAGEMNHPLEVRLLIIHNYDLQLRHLILIRW